MFIYKYTETCNSKGTIMGNIPGIEICLPSERYGQKLVWGRLCHRNHDETCKNSIMYDASYYIFCVCAGYINISNGDNSHMISICNEYEAMNFIRQITNSCYHLMNDCGVECGKENRFLLFSVCA